ncbi:MAG: hypothetical protein AB8B65_16010 [Kordia sp.]|uniref:hypothetical protein n=1 Tax=Kordia sp. TaxID=1965332 RepID=UPI00385F4F97
MEYSYFRYFLATYLTLVVTFGVLFLLQETIDLIDKTLLILLIPFAIALLISPIFYWKYPPSDLQYRYRKHKKKVFKKFMEEHNFSHSENGYVYGVIENYPIMIYAARNLFPANNEWIEAKIVFNPKREHEFIATSIINNIKRKYNDESITWYVNSVLIKQYYKVKLPKYEVVYPLLKRCISELKANAIAPISHNEWQQMLPETIAHYQNHEKL